MSIPKSKGNSSAIHTSSRPFFIETSETENSRTSLALAGPAFQTPRPARGLAVGDLDGDGREEIVLVNMNSTPSLLKNDGPHGHYLNLLLSGTRSNRSAIGARAIVTAGGRKRIDEVMSGGSYYSQNSFTLHFGLGECKRADQIEIRWPSGIIQTLGPVAANQTLKIVETVKQ